VPLVLGQIVSPYTYVNGFTAKIAAIRPGSLPPRASLVHPAPGT
jgi:hypothetical protein